MRSALAGGLGEGEVLLDVLQRLLAHAWQVFQFAAVELLFEHDGVGHPALLPERGHGLGPEAGDLQQLDHVAGHLLHEVVVFLDVAGVEVLGDALSGAFADAVDLLQGMHVADFAHILGQFAEDAGGFLKGVHAKAVAAEDLGDIRHLLEQRREFGVGVSHGTRRVPHREVGEQRRGDRSPHMPRL